MFTNTNNKKKLNRIIAPAIALAVLVGASPSFAYTVQKGDTLSEIARNHNLKLNDIVELNPQIKNINMIYVGDTVNTNKAQEVAVKTTVNVDSNTNDATQNEKALLSRLVEAEAKGESFAGKVAVAEVVLNRTKSSQFPDSITGVIHQKGQFSPVANGSINKPASEESKRAVQEAFSIGDNTNGAIYFYNPTYSSSSWLDSKQTTTKIGNHVFKR